PQMLTVLIMTRLKLRVRKKEKDLAGGNVLPLIQIRQVCAIYVDPTQTSSSQAWPNSYVGRRLCVATTRSNSPRTRVSLFPAPKTQSVFHPHAQRNAFRSHARQQSRWFALQNQRLGPSRG